MNEAGMEEGQTTYHIRIRNGLPRILLLPPSLPFTTELANESDSGVTGELLLVFIHGIGTQCTLNSGVSSWCTLPPPAPTVL